MFSSSNFWKKSNRLIITINSNVLGIGKSTCIDGLDTILRANESCDVPVRLYKEPLMLWETVMEEHDVTLESLYANPDSSTIQNAFQMKVLGTLIAREFSMKEDSGILIQERSLLQSIPFVETLNHFQRIPDECSLSTLSRLPIKYAANQIWW